MPRDVETLASKIAQHQALTELDATGWIIRLARALEPIHALGVAHGNITAEALRLDGVARTSRAVLADARHLSDLPAYHSPERAGGEGPSVADDTWAVGVILYLALTGSFPFPGASDGEVRAKIFGPPAAPLAVFDVGDDGLQQILDRAFARDAAERLGNIRELREALEEWHPDRDVKSLPPLDDDDGEPSGGAFPAISRGMQAQSQVSRAQPPVVRAAPLAQATPVVPAAPVAQATPVVPAAPMSHSGLLPASDEEDGPTQVRGASSVHQYLAALQATPGPAAAPIPPTPVAAPPVAATPGTPAPALAAAPATERGSRLRRLPAPMPPPMKQSPSVAPGAMPLSAMATSEFPSAERSGLARAGLFDDEEPTMFAVPSSLARPRPEPSPEPAASSHTPMFPEAAPPVAATEAPSNTSHAALAGPAPVATNHPPSSTAHDAPSSAADDAPAPHSETQGKRRSRTPIFAGLVLLLAGAATVVFLVGSGASPEQPTSTPSASAQLSANPSSSAVAAAPPPSAAASAPPAAAVSASPSTAVTTSPSTAVTTSPTAAVTTSPTAAATTSATTSPDAVAACLMPMFAAGTFAAPPASLASLCAITDPRKGGETIRTEVILGGAGRNVSDGMREWGVLGLYEMAAFAILRASCCPSAAALDIPISVPTCDIESPLKSLAEVASSATATDAAVEDALKAYTKEARCISRAGASSAYGQKSRLQGGELETFQKTLARARAVVKKK